MAMTFHGTGSVWDVQRHRFLRFVNGSYTAQDEHEEAVLASFPHDPVREPIIQPHVEEIPEGEKPKRGRPKNA